MKKKRLEAIKSMSYILEEFASIASILCTVKSVRPFNISIHFPGQLNFQVLFLHLQNARLYLKVLSCLLNSESFLQLSSEYKGQYVN